MNRSTLNLYFMSTEYLQLKPAKRTHYDNWNWILAVARRKNWHKLISYKSHKSSAIYRFFKHTAKPNSFLAGYNYCGYSWSPWCRNRGPYSPASKTTPIISFQSRKSSILSSFMLHYVTILDGIHNKFKKHHFFAYKTSLVKKQHFFRGEKRYVPDKLFS